MISIKLSKKEKEERKKEDYFNNGVKPWKGQQEVVKKNKQLEEFF